MEICKHCIICGKDKKHNMFIVRLTLIRGYPAERALSAMRKHGG